MRQATTILLSIACLAYANQAIALDCPLGHGIYRGTLSGKHQIEFTAENPGKLEYSGKLLLVNGGSVESYNFVVNVSNGFSRAFINIETRNKDDHPPSSVLMQFGSGMRPFKGKGHAPYIVTPELAVQFYYWPRVKSMPEFPTAMLPDDAWKLVGCK